MGKLTIAGKTKLTDLVATLTYNAGNKTFNCTGTKKLKMSEYGVKPPTAMMGTIKTGDDKPSAITSILKDKNAAS